MGRRGGSRSAPGIIGRLKSIFKPDRQRQEERKARRESKKKKKDEAGKGGGSYGRVHRSRIAHRRYAHLIRQFGIKS